MTLSARGVGDQAFVEFTSLAGSFQSLAAQAGDDDTLSSSENFSTQITNVSTAQAVFLQEANSGQPVTSDAALQSLSATLNAQDVLDLAAVIKLAVDDAASHPLPEGQTSILALASNATARQAFINEVVTNHPEAFAAAQTAIAQDPNLVQPLEGDVIAALSRGQGLHDGDAVDRCAVHVQLQRPRRSLRPVRGRRGLGEHGHLRAEHTLDRRRLDDQRDVR